jgi:hypothetical protein
MIVEMIDHRYDRLSPPNACMYKVYSWHLTSRVQVAESAAAYIKSGQVNCGLGSLNLCARGMNIKSVYGPYDLSNDVAKKLQQVGYGCR